MAARGKKRISKQARTALLFLAPSLLGITGMFLLPTLDVIRRAFFTAMGERFVGLDNFITVLSNESFLLALKNTGRFIIVCIPLLLASSLAAAIVLLRQKWCQNLFKTTYLLPMVIPVTSVVLIIQALFTKNGLLSALVCALGGQGADWLNSDYAFFVLVICYLWKNFGYNVVLWMAGLSAIPASYYEAARMDGANEWQCFKFITLPQLSSTVFMTAVLALINSFKVFREAYLVAGSYPNNSIYMLQHILSNWFANLDMQKISAAAVLIMALILLIVFLVQLIGSKRGEEL